jgi:sialate O-acetylesterase
VGAGLVSRSGNSLKGFAIAGVDKTFIPAQARLAGNQVVVWSKRVSHPTAVRYAFINALETSLYGQDGLPVPPFRTDDWPLVDPPDE